jgi:hypothetical protein
MHDSQALEVANKLGLRIVADEGGGFAISCADPDWQFSGRTPGRVVNSIVDAGEDRAGRYQEIAFIGVAESGAKARWSIRLYDERSVALFEASFVDPGDARASFPVLAHYPTNLFRLGYASVFGGYSFDRLGADGPWVFFDERANAFILSPASNFMNAALKLGAKGELVSGLTTSARKIPAGFVHATALVVTKGINRCFAAWGKFLTDLAGKKRPANDADVGLKYLGYWTDRGAHYYYRTEPGLDYPDTLLKVRDEFRRADVPLGYMQIDSWFYPKGHEAKWRSEDRLGGGAYLYEAAQEIFPQGLGAFQQELGLPLITHNRWIDAHSPYRKTYAISGNMSVDPRLWGDWMLRLRDCGVVTYEQDWLSGPAHADRTLPGGEDFMRLMAEAAQAENLTLQYCMPLPRHFLQGSKYSNLTTIRTSADRFGRNRWKAFLFNGRLATAIGAWPWTDVFMSSETSNLLVATLSGGMVGVGDAIGELDRVGLMRAIRADGVIVKPDRPLTPLDWSYVAQAKDPRSAVVSTAQTAHGGHTTTYLFAFRPDRGERNAKLPVRDLGYAGPVFAFDYFEQRGVRLDCGDELSFSISKGGAYWIVAPIGASGAALLGDPDKFVGLGRQRVASVSDNGRLRARLVLAENESRVRLRGFSPSRPEVEANGGKIEALTYDAETGLFVFDLAADLGGSPEIAVTPDRS